MKNRAKKVSNLVFYAQSTSVVILGQKNKAVRKRRQNKHRKKVLKIAGSLTLKSFTVKNKAK